MRLFAIPMFETAFILQWGSVESIRYLGARFGSVELLVYFVLRSKLACRNETRLDQCQAMQGSTMLWGNDSKNSRAPSRHTVTTIHSDPDDRLDGPNGGTRRIPSDPCYLILACHIGGSFLCLSGQIRK